MSNMINMNWVVLVIGVFLGIGWVCVLCLVVDGFVVVVGGRNVDWVGVVVDEILVVGGMVIMVLGDVVELGYGEVVVVTVVGMFGCFDVLVNVVGVIIWSDVEGISDEEWYWVMSINVDGLFWISRVVLFVLWLVGGGVIVNISFINGLVGVVGLVVYCVFKGVVINFIWVMVLDYVVEGIWVNVVCLGVVDIYMLYLECDRMVDEVCFINFFDILEGCILVVEEVVYLVVFLVDDCLWYVNGVNFSVDGGYMVV